MTPDTIRVVRKPTQVERLVEYLHLHPESSGLEIIHALNMPKYTGRISDARAAGIDVVCSRRSDGRLGYRIVSERERVTTGTAQVLGI